MNKCTSRNWGYVIPSKNFLEPLMVEEWPEKFVHIICGDGDVLSLHRHETLTELDLQDMMTLIAVFFCMAYNLCLIKENFLSLTPFRS